jgi:undecaprenyl diphosphate synthase
MMQSDNSASPFHVALIPDGNGRWALRRGRPRPEGHRVGLEVVRRIVDAAPRLGITTLTLFAFSVQNWERPAPEVAHLMEAFETYLREVAWRAAEHRGRITVLGRRDRFSPGLTEAIKAAEAATTHGAVLHLRLAVDYSARDEILRAASAPATAPTREEFAARLAPDHPAPVDFLIRTGGDLRLSDFMLWECAYAELYFTPTLWPDFTVAEFETALADFHQRQRRFGRLLLAVAGAGAS